MPVSETLQPLVNTNGMPVDPNVRVPDRVREAADAAEAAHKAAYAPQPEPEPAPAAAAAAEDPPAPATQDPPAPAAAAEDSFTGPAPADALQSDDWAKRYNAMRGRWEQETKLRKQSEVQLHNITNELMVTQGKLADALRAASSGTPVPAQREESDHNNLITEADRQNYGDELLDTIRRTALAATTPELAKLRADNAKLTKAQQVGAKRDMFVALDKALPQWRQINTSVQFQSWLRLPNVYTGQVRQSMLDKAVGDAHASTVLQFFKDFLLEVAATGQSSSGNDTVPPIQAPHAAALDLGTLAAPGRARPATGEGQGTQVDKPIYTRKDIGDFYEAKRKGFYAGRDAEVQAFERDLGLAQREGRVR